LWLVLGGKGGGVESTARRRKGVCEKSNLKNKRKKNWLANKVNCETASRVRRILQNRGQKLETAWGSRFASRKGGKPVIKYKSETKKDKVRCL